MGGWGVRSCSRLAPLRNKRGNTEKREGGLYKPPRFHYHVNLEREGEMEKEKQAGQGPAVGPDPYGAAGSGMNSEWSGWAAGICLQAFVNRMTKDKRELCRWPRL